MNLTFADFKNTIFNYIVDKLECQFLSLIFLALQNFLK